MKSKHIGCAVIAVVIVSIVIAFVNSPFYLICKHMMVTEYTTFSIPNSDVEIEHSRIGTHMLAEYDRWLTVVLNGKRFATHELAIDTCGGYPINCYLLKNTDGPILYLNDAVSEHLVYLSNGAVLAYPFGDQSGKIASLIEQGEPKYIGRLDGKLGQLRLIPATESEEIQIGHSDRKRRW